MRIPTPEEVARAEREIEEEDERARLIAKRLDAVGEFLENARKRQEQDIQRRSSLPSEHPEHIHGMMCDGQDGMNSHCCRLRRKLFGTAKTP